MERDRLRSQAADLILVRLLDPGKAGLTPGRVAKDLEGIFSEVCSPADWVDLVGKALEDLVGLGQVAAPSKGRARGLRLSDAGRKAALEYLGVGDLTAGTKWKTIRDIHLVARALGLRDRSAGAVARLKGVADLRGAILRRRYSLPIPEYPRADQALRALLWRQLGADGDRPFTLKAVQELLLSKLVDSPRELNLPLLKALLPAQAVRARRTDAAELRSALLRELAEETDAAGGGGPRPGPEAGEGAPTGTAEMDGIAREILDAARRSPTGWFGEERVFIAHAWRSYRALHPGVGLDLGAFKERLVDLNRLNLLSLGRADLVEAMDRNDVEESEATYLNARFHFLRVPGGKP